MNSKILELIEYAIKDGVITAKERIAIYKTAESYGYSREEVDLVMDAKLLETQKSKASTRGQILGQTKHCPACGSLVNSGQLKCQDCGYEFSGIGPNAFVKEYQNQLEYVLSKVREDKKRVKVESQFISTYPLPLSKEDSIEMLNYLRTLIQPSNKSWLSYLNYYNAVLARVKSLSRGDKDLQYLIADFENYAKKAKKRKYIFIGVICGLVSMIILSFVLYFAFIHEPNVSNNVNKCRRVVMKLINENNLVKARKLLFTYRAPQPLFFEDEHKYEVDDVYAALIDAAIKTNDIEMAISVVDQYITTKEVGRYNVIANNMSYYLIAKGEYERAEKYIDMEWQAEDFLKRCVVDMCAKQKYNDAKKFLTIKAIYIDDYKRDRIVEELNKIIQNSENGAIQ